MIHWPKGLDAEAFLARYWQKHPLLLPGALPDFHSPLDGDELAGLACEEDVESRLITYSANEWSVQHGPFDQEDFGKLPESGWTLLVQDVEKHLPELASVFVHFDFLPRWRLDDLMISYAVSGGTVGPHLDEYDVFLIQGQGHRSWSIDPVPDDLSVLPDLELKVLRNFAAKKQWHLDVGDILYLPPGVAHHGISDSPGITLSLGFRAPAARDLLRTMATMLEEDDRPRRYGDQDLGPQEVSGSRISGAAVGRAAKAMALENRRVAECLGRNVTEVKPWLRPDPSTNDETVAGVLDKLRQGDILRRHSMSRYAWNTDRDTVRIYVDGESWPLRLDCEGFVLILCEEDGIGLVQLGEWLQCDAAISTLCDIIGQGSLVWKSDGNEGVAG
jgi:50S ribosomal protein L16 3-hydroxylase